MYILKDVGAVLTVLKLAGSGRVIGDGEWLLKELSAADSTGETEAYKPG